MYNIQGLRAVALYRVSTAKQATRNDKDVPAQRKLVGEFIETEELLLMREFIESGISGYKTSIEDRDALALIKSMADSKEMEVLVVYHSDRIGRSAEETPLVINYLNDKGIKIFSVKEGEIKSKTQMDRLFTWMMYWQNENESVKISNRSTDYHIIAIQNGKYRGGGEKTVPFGYRLVDRGALNPRGRRVLDFEIDEEQAEIVRLIFSLSVENNLGARAIASYLNENGYREKSKNGSGWTFTTIMFMLNNIIYNGFMHMYSNVKGKEYVSPKQEHLVIIHDDIWELNQKALKNRKTIENKQVAGATNSRVLLSGLVLCGHCGSKMQVWANHKYYKRKDGNKTRFVVDSYRCHSAVKKGLIQCDGQTTYSAKKIEGIVEKQVVESIMEISQRKLPDSFLQGLKENMNKLHSDKEKKLMYLETQQKQILTLKKEIPGAIAGESKWSEQDLRECLTLIQSEADALMKEIEEIGKEVINTKILDSKYQSMNSSIGTWNKQYENSDIAGKKALLWQIIHKVIITKEGVEIMYKNEFDTFQRNSI